MSGVAFRGTVYPLHSKGTVSLDYAALQLYTLHLYTLQDRAVKVLNADESKNKKSQALELGIGVIAHKAGGYLIT